ARAGGEWSDDVQQLAVHSPVDRHDLGERLVAVGLRAEGEVEHYTFRVPQALDCSGGTSDKVTVLVDAGGDEGVRELEKDRARPAEEHEALGVYQVRDRGAGWFGGLGAQVHLLVSAIG